MKKSIILLLSFCMGLISQAQPATALIGSWTGKLDVGVMSITLVINVEQVDGDIKCTLDSPDQGAKGLPATKEHLSDDSLALKFDLIGATFRGKLVEQRLQGTFTQSGQSFALNLEHNAPPVRRPQHPQSPYPYTTQEVTFSNTADGATLAGTLTLPTNYDPKSRPTVVLLVSGSGQQNRDEELMGHKPFLVLAHHLALNGIASLRYDDRGFGASTGGELIQATTLDFMRDANAGIDYLLNLNQFGQIGCLGHSEGATIAFMLAAQNKVDFVISMAGPGVKGDTLLTAQANRILLLSGQPANVTIEQYRHTLTLQHMPWLEWFSNYDPSSDIQATHCPTMAINGELDCQVIASLNLPAINQLLPANNKNLVKLYPGLNHLFQHCTTGHITEYSTIEQTIAPEVLDDITRWIRSL